MNSAFGVPDGGWGWAVVAGTAIINVFNQSILSTFGLLFGPKLERIAGTTAVTTVMSLNCTITNFTGFLISPLSRYLSIRQITQIGVLLVSVGLILSSFTPYCNVIVGYGLLTGLGLGFIASSTFLIINSYFTKNKSQAVGLSMAGTSIGQMIMPPTVAFLSDEYGYNGAILILGAMSLHGVIGSLFFDPVSNHLVPLNNTESKRQEDSVIVNVTENNNSNDTDEENTQNNTLLNADSSEDTKSPEMEPLIHDHADDNYHAQRVLSRKELDVDNAVITEDDSLNCWQKLVQYFDFHLLLDPIFAHIMIGLSLSYTTNVSFSTFFPLFLMSDLEMSIIEASTCISALSLMDFIGRIVVPLITKRLELTHRTTFIVSSFLLAIFRTILVEQRSYQMIMWLSATTGLVRAANVITQNLVIAEYSKEADVPSALGLYMVSKGIFILGVAEILGVYTDSAHNFGSCIHVLNIISTTVGISWTLEILFRKVLCTRIYRKSQ